jgi:hypothetical protein
VGSGYRHGKAHEVNVAPRGDGYPNTADSSAHSSGNGLAGVYFREPLPVGEPKYVGGQEDMIIDIAVQLAAKRDGDGL